MSERDELLPCPFCGSLAEVQKDRGMFSALCSEDCHMSFAAFSSEEYLKSAWIRRADTSDGARE